MNFREFFEILNFRFVFLEKLCVLSFIIAFTSNTSAQQVILPIVEKFCDQLPSQIYRNVLTL
jgi:hypothetical protein